MPYYLHGVASILVAYLLAFLVSDNKKKISWKVLCYGILCQLLLAYLVLKVPIIISSIKFINKGMYGISESTDKAMAFCFGGLANPSAESGLGFMLAFKGLPVIITVSAISALLTYLRILPFIIKMLSIFFRKTLLIGGALGIGAAANIFVGMSETPLVMRSYLKNFSRSEIFSLMVLGTTGIASSMMVVYTIIVDSVIQNSMYHIVSSVIIGIPGALTISRVIVPETRDHLTEGEDVDFGSEKTLIGAICTGVIEGAKILVIILAMLVGFVALVDLLNKILALVTIGDMPLSMQLILGWLISPLAWLIGVPWTEAQIAGSLLGTKIIFNEVIGFQELVKVGADLSERTKVILIYAICGFANVSSVGMMIGIYKSLVPERIDEVAKFGLRALLAGMLANCMSAAIAGMLTGISV